MYLICSIFESLFIYFFSWIIANRTQTDNLQNKQKRILKKVHKTNEIMVIVANKQKKKSEEYIILLLAKLLNIKIKLHNSMANIWRH